MLRLLAVAALVVWPLNAIFLVQLHITLDFWRKIRRVTYLVIGTEWLFASVVVIELQDLLLGPELDLGALSWFGLISMLVGMGLHTWTGWLLGLKGLMGYPEIKPRSVSQKLVTTGPFSVARHPTYLAHTLMFVGVFLMTGFLGTGLLALIDFMTSYFIIIPLEERELEARFGNEYRRYRQGVPKFIPRFSRS